jgi:hypothetical protein
MSQFPHLSLSFIVTALTVFNVLLLVVCLRQFHKKAVPGCFAVPSVAKTNMTADELFLQHAAKHVASYHGILKSLRDAVEQGYVPAAGDQNVRSYVEQLKQYLVNAGTPEEDDFLLRFALLAPGLQRGIRPPMDVLKPSRGGFSQPRLLEAAGQAAHLREALRVGSHLLGDLSTDTRTASFELANRLRAADSAQGDWVEMHASLSPDEASALAALAIAFWILRERSTRHWAPASLTLWRISGTTVWVKTLPFW